MFGWRKKIIAFSNMIFSNRQLVMEGEFHIAVGCSFDVGVHEHGYLLSVSAGRRQGFRHDAEHLYFFP